jgi:hypothetical protein
MAQDWATVSMVMNLWVPQNGGNFLSSCVTSSFSQRPQLHGVHTFFKHTVMISSDYRQSLDW